MASLVPMPPRLKPNEEARELRPPAASIISPENSGANFTEDV